MKLRIKKDQEQKTGLLGNNKGAKFFINFKVDLTETETDLVNKYKVLNYVIYRREAPQLLITVKSLVDGQTVVSDDIFELINIEDIIKTSCQNLLNMTLFMSTFGGEEIIDIVND